MQRDWAVQTRDIQTTCVRTVREAERLITLLGKQCEQHLIDMGSVPPIDESCMEYVEDASHTGKKRKVDLLEGPIEEDSTPQSLPCSACS